jgi:SusD family.
MPTGTVVVDGGIKSVEESKYLRNYINVLIRTIYSGSAIYDNELMSDLFNQTINYDNRGGSTYRMEWSAAESETADYWASCYVMNDHANYCNSVIDALSNNQELTDSDRLFLKHFRGESAFLKAVAMFELAQRYCALYDEKTANDEYGVILTDIHNPTSNYKTYKPRATLLETYNDIIKNLNMADTLLADVKGTEASIYITKDVVTAFYARVAVAMGNYKLAAEKSSSLIESGTYPLIDNIDSFKELWHNDSGKECIMQSYASLEQESLPSSLSFGYSTHDELGNYKPDYIPQRWVIDLYKASDLRFKVWFEQHNLVYGAIKNDAVILNKFPGNRSLQSNKASSDYVHKVKPFRIAEQYLIAAEAYSMINQDAKAVEYLNTLKSKRDPDAILINYSGMILKDEIKKERVRELVGEGFRFLDIKRYKEGFSRKSPQASNIVYDPTNTSSALLSVKAGDYRFLWPIPQSEIDANPYIKSQQNKGY